MSTPVRKRHDVPPQDGPSDDGPSKYAPKRTRLPKADPDKELAGVNAAPMSESTESPDPPWRRKDQPGAFVDDLDIGEMRNRIGRVERVAEPPVPDSSGWMPTAARRLALIVGTAAGVAAVVIGYRWDTVPPTASTQQQPAHGGAEIVVVTAPESLAPVERPQPPSPNDNQPDAQLATAGLGSWPSLPSASAAPLGRQDPPGPASAPSPAPSPQQLDAAQIAIMVKRGGEFMANGNIGAARVMLRPAAEAGDAKAAFALAETYDPFVLERLGAKGGISSDVAQARRWYEAAKGLGSTAATDRLVRLARRSE